jgi:hypothetical protein
MVSSYLSIVRVMNFTGTCLLQNLGTLLMEYLMAKHEGVPYFILLAVEIAEVLTAYDQSFFQHPFIVVHWRSSRAYETGI